MPCLLLRTALRQNAYQAGVNPAQTQGRPRSAHRPNDTDNTPRTADLIALDQALHALADVLRQSGVGAYPLPPTDANADADTRNAASPPTEQELITDTTRGVQQLYEEFKRMQESSAVVANLLGAPENVGRSKA
ncbi:hypothetical protein V8E55_007857 [Tylopilus felleus]